MSDSGKKSLVIVGGGGHASVLADILREQKKNILAVICPGELSNSSVFEGIPHLHDDDEIRQFHPNSVELVNGIGGVADLSLRKSIGSKYSSLGYSFARVISSDAFVAKGVQCSSGVQVLRKAIVQVGAIIGENTIVNTNSLIEHDCLVGRDNHIAPRSTLCGAVRTGESVFVGANAVIIQGIKIAAYSVVGAGAVVTKSIDQASTVFPAKGLLLPALHR